MYRLSFIILLVCCSQIAPSQNLFVNQGFEEINWCSEYNVPCAPVGWFNIKPADIPKVDGRFIPKALLGKHLWPVPVENIANPEQRPFVYTMLKCPLRKGSRYKLSFYLNTGRIPFYHIDFSFFFDEPLNPVIGVGAAVIKILPAHTSEMRTGWKFVELDFIATGDQQFCVIGNLSPGLLPFSADAAMNKSGHVFYFLDDVKLRPADGMMCLEADSTVQLISRKTSRHTEGVSIVEADKKIFSQDTLVLPSIVFLTDEWEPRPGMKAAVDSIAQLIAAKRFSRIDVVGHTDNTGSVEHNRRLSMKRAMYIKTLLSSLRNDSSPFIFATGKGPDEPVAGNDTDEGRARNRRVEIILTY